jgi:GT2 family glycosyltransferase
VAPSERACVDVVIPTHRAPALVERCVEHLVDASIASRIVVDDASGDDTAQRLGGRAGVRVVALSEQRGLAHAYNRGAQRGSAPLVLFLNNDILPVPGAIDRLVGAFCRHAEAGSAAGRLVDVETGRTQPSYGPRAVPGPLAVAARLAGVERCWPRNPLTGQHLRRPLPEDRATLTRRQPAGACLLVRRADHERLGGWDERDWIWYEDVDYSRRLLGVGPALYEPRAVFRHVGGATTGRWDKPEQHRRLYHGTLQYGSAHFGRLGRAVLGTTAVAVSVPRVLGYRRRDPRAAAVYRAVLRGGLALVRGREVPSLMPR